MPLFVTITPLLQSRRVYLPQTVVYCGAWRAPGAASTLVICVVVSVGIVVAWSAPGAVTCCTCRMCCYMYVYCGALNAPGLSGLAVLGICVDVLAIWV